MGVEILGVLLMLVGDGILGVGRNKDVYGFEVLSGMRVLIGLNLLNVF